MDGSMRVVFQEGGEGAISVADEEWYSTRPAQCDDICFYDMKAVGTMRTTLPSMARWWFPC